MKNFSFIQFMLYLICFFTVQQGIAANSGNCKTPKLGPYEGICFFIVQQCITADSGNCNTPQLGPNDKLLISIFDNDFKFGFTIWDRLCGAIEQFPPGLVTVEYRPGALAKGTIDNIKCGSSDCKNDQLEGCKLVHSKYYNVCGKDLELDFAETMKCYCSKAINKLLLENGQLRESWNIPEDAVPTLAVNQAYDSCFKFGSEQDIVNYLCTVYQKQVGKCG